MDDRNVAARVQSKLAMEIGTMFLRLIEAQSRLESLQEAIQGMKEERRASNPAEASPEDENAA